MKSYFEGWYFKHQFKGMSLGLIPGVAKEKDGGFTAFIQVITPDYSEYITYPITGFQLRRNPLKIQIGDCVFTKKGVKLDLETQKFSIKGKLTYGPMNSYGKPIMGFFSKFPGMECNHEVLSMYHTINGNLMIGKKGYHIENGCGYVEKDWGHSFPKSYRWSQCIYEKGHTPTSVFTAIATIPYLGVSFTGVICCILHKEQFICLATYKGARVVLKSNHLWIIKQGKYTLVVRLFPNENAGSQELRAPSMGHMSDTIKEELTGRIQYQLFEHADEILSFKSRHGSMEIVN